MTNHNSDFTGADTVIVRTPNCMMCQKPGSIAVPAAGFAAWQAGALVQSALPSLTADERELLISGTHPACWDEMFAGEEE